MSRGSEGQVYDGNERGEGQNGRCTYTMAMNVERCGQGGKGWRIKWKSWYIKNSDR